MTKAPKLYLVRRTPENTIFVSDEDSPNRIRELAFKFIEEESRLHNEDSIEVIEIVNRDQAPKEWEGENIVWGEEYLSNKVRCELTINNYFANKDNWNNVLKNNNEERIKELKAQRAKIDEEIRNLLTIKE